MLPQRRGKCGARGSRARAAIASKIERHNLIETRIREMMEEGTLLVDMHGSCVGQVNGLSVSGDRRLFVRQAGAHYGQRGAGQVWPDQYRARVQFERTLPRQGRAHHRGISAQHVRERQAALAGRQHLLRAVVFGRRRRQRQLDGNLRAAFRAFRVAVAAGPCRDRFDEPARRYSGRSAASTKRSKDFSILAGSMGLTGTQGVLIPAANVEDLMLREDVLDAVAGGQFSYLAGVPRGAGN